MMQPIYVNAYAGYQGEQEPLSIVYNSEKLKVLNISDRWYDPSGKYFKVRASDGSVYLLKCTRETLDWFLIKKWTSNS